MTETVKTRFIYNIYPAALWTSENPTLLDREIGIEKDTGKEKWGDGVTAWNSLAYAPVSLVGALLTSDLGVTVQAYDADLAAIAALSPTNDDFIQRKAGAWTNRTIAQLKTDLGGMANQAANAVAVSGGTAVGLSYLQITGSTPPGGMTGSGLEMIGGGSATFQAYSRTGGAYINMYMDGLEVLIRPSGTERARFGSYGARVTGSLRPSSYTVATLPSASTHGAGALIYVSDEIGGAVPAFSDNTNWRRVTDRAVVS